MYLLPLLLLREILKLVLFCPLELGHQVFQALGIVLLAHVLVPLQPLLLYPSLFLDKVILLGFHFYFVLL